jgi:alkylated DNA nucleotide flippase Atl1
MARGSKIPAVVHWIVIRLSSVHTVEDIAMFTGISARSVERILHFNLHGTIDHKEEERKRRRQYLRDMDVEVSILPFSMFDD